MPSVFGVRPAATSRWVPSITPAGAVTDVEGPERNRLPWLRRMMDAGVVGPDLRPAVQPARAAAIALT